MRDYEKLASDLREMAEWVGPDNYELPITLYDRLVEAADAIEELLGKPNGKWVPATEPPPKGETYGDTTFSVDVLGTEAFTYRKAYYNFRAKVWLDGSTEEEWPSITHWMPLPEPPKEDDNE